MLKPDSYKGYTVGDNTNKNLSKHPYRLDDEKLMYPFYEKLVKWSATTPSLKNVCIHKGLFPPSVAKQFPHLADYADVRDVGKAAKDWPKLNFIIYHGGYRYRRRRHAPRRAGRSSSRAAASTGSAISPRFRRSTASPTSTRTSARLFAQTTIAEPRLSAVMMGQLIKGMGADHVVLGHRRDLDRRAAVADRGAAAARDSRGASRRNTASPRWGPPTAR